MSAAKHFKAVFSKRNLRQIFNDHIRNTAAKGIDRTHPAKLSQQLKEELEIICRKVNYGSYRFTAYKEKLISKGANGVPRVISIPTVRDRIVLRAMCDLLARVFPLATPEIPQVKIDALRIALGQTKYAEYIKIDLCQFYPSIPHSRLLQTLKQKIRKPEILNLFELAIKTPTVPEHRGSRGAVDALKGVPQGLAISNILAEVFLQKFDDEMKKNADIWYRRYIDDILILCPPNSAPLIAQNVCSTLKGMGLNPHELNQEGSKSKADALTKDFEFLGYHIANRQLSIRETTIRKFESSLAEVFTAYKHRLLRAKTPQEVERAIKVCEWRLNLRLTGCIFGGKRLGWAFYFSQVTDTSRLRAIDNTVQQMITRFSLKGKIKVKTLLKTYYECRRKDKSDHRYIPNFDEHTIADQRNLLFTLVGDSRILSLSATRIHQLFLMKIGAAVRELEQDLARMS